MTLGSSELPLRIAIVGSGPSGCFAVESLLKSETQVHVDVFDRLPSPFGLVRAGVAPDHQKIKSIILKFEKLFQDQRVQFFGNVCIGQDIPLAVLQEYYDGIIFCHGAEKDKKLSIPGADLKGCHSATEFVGWYNAHPDYRASSFNLQSDSAVIIGQGNVAIDVARILAKPIDELASTDMADYALEALSQSKIRDIYIVGRRGPVQAAFTDKELRELTEIPNCQLKVSASDLKLADQCELELAENPKGKSARNFKILESLGSSSSEHCKRTIHLVFFSSPIECRGTHELEEIIFVRNRLEGSAGSQRAVATDKQHAIKSGLLFTSIGYRGEGIEGLPFDLKSGIYWQSEGRVLKDNTPITGLYVAGWIKRGPTGVIGTNKADANETVRSLLSDVESLTLCAKRDSKELVELIEAKHIPLVTYEDWKVIDQEEISRGKVQGKVRQKFSSKEEMLDFLKSRSS